MFGSVEPTEYDLKFELFGIPVRVSPWFWLMGAILGFDTVKMGAPYLLSWMSVVFVSILVHEFGHALVSKSFGYRPRVLLYQFGGLAFYEPDSKYSRSRAILISLAGPGAGFLLYGLTYAAAHLVFVRVAGSLSEESAYFVSFTIAQLLYVNLFWGLLNLLPVIPLDGGRVCQEICMSISPYRGMTFALQVGGLVAGGVAVWFLTQERFYPAILFGILCANNISALQQRRW